MHKDITHSKSISDISEMLGLEKPTHPLIQIYDTSKITYGEDAIGSRFSSDMYCIAMKDADCGVDYGRNTYDFNDGVLVFFAPNQVISVTRPQALNQVQGWMLYFHPDLIRNTALGDKIDQYSFFDYAVHEALHLSDQEQGTMNQCVQLIQDEILQRVDDHSQSVIVSNLELMLNYSSRYYHRQFNTRSSQNTDVVSKVERLLKDYFNANMIAQNGQPTIQYLADKCNLSSTYLSDLLTKETGRSAKDHINDFLVEKAKNRLLGSSEPISTIAYDLGFNYPHYFGRLFKQKTGMTPQSYRQMN